MLMRNPGPVKAHSFRRLNAPCGGEWNEGSWVGPAGFGQPPVDTFPGSGAQAGQPCPDSPFLVKIVSLFLGIVTHQVLFTEEL